MLDQIVIILHQPQDVRNIGAVVRSMKNMGLRRLRLVRPAPFSPADILGIAHRSDDILGDMAIYNSLDLALADLGYLVGTSARRHAGRPVRADVETFAGELLARTAHGPVGVLFGPEDNGLDNVAIDRCNALLSLPADPAYPSLNLAQAALLLMYELRRAAQLPPPAPPARAPADVAALEACFGALERMLAAIEFVKSGQVATPMRALRAVIHRAAPDPHEAALLTAIAREVEHVVGRLRKNRVE